MKKYIYLLLLLIPVSFISQAYTWQYAKNGGGDNGSSGNFPDWNDEMILDIAVDNEGNNYYLTYIYSNNQKLDGTAIPVYGTKNVLLFSTDCVGNIRWTRVIGGSENNFYAQKIVLDNLGHLYLSFKGYNQATVNNQGYYNPLTFGAGDVMPVRTVQNNTSTDPALNSGFLLKYSTSTGELLLRKTLQGPVSQLTRPMDLGNLYRDSSGTFHVMMGFLKGSHLDGQITVPPTYDNPTGNSGYPNGLQYYIVKFDSNFNMVGTPLLLPITGYISSSDGMVQFMYDDALNRYYLAGSRSVNFGNFTPFSYNNVPITKDGFIIAINGTSGLPEWRKEFTNDNTALQPYVRVYGLLKDSNSNIYISGRYYQSFSSTSYLEGYTLPNNLRGNIPYVIKIAPDTTGTIQWVKTPTALSDGATDIARAATRMPIALKGNEIAFAFGAIREVWDTYSMVRPANDGKDPLLVRLNKETGAVIATHDIKSDFGFEDEFTAIAKDNDGNYVLGGFFHSQLFTDPNDNIPTMTYLGSNTSQFFITKLANSACSAMATAETPVKETDVVFYPNPVEDVLNIKTKEKLASYEILTADGRMVKQGKFEKTGYAVDMQGLTPGVYYIKVAGEKFATAGKVVKK